MIEKAFPLRRVRSFVKRDGRMTESQHQAFQQQWPRFGLRLEDGFIDFEKVFQRKAPRILEIGFGSGRSLLAMARQHPEEDYMGIEMYKPGIGALLLGMELENLSNIRIYYADAVEVLERCIPDASLDVIQIFFPDPWPKRKHHKRRLIQADFVRKLATKLQLHGILHLATDWEDYAKEMMIVLSEAEEFINLAGHGSFAERSSQRPVVTKFEERGTRSGRKTWELQFAKRE